MANDSGGPGGPSPSERDRQYCELCGKMENLLRCSRCRSSFYCSKEHQRQDWKKHKLVCQVGEKVPAPGTGQPLSRAARRCPGPPEPGRPGRRRRSGTEPSRPRVRGPPETRPRRRRRPSLRPTPRQPRPRPARPPAARVG
ncbi:unnamed protein product [Rangifer tarandus platyrhynchus]|uniref:Uncharacterized protein n=1 Tax=Rangifer tarandus platyrhynchus TaxID=3082113 RepID=A0ACB1KFK4_RANTA